MGLSYNILFLLAFFCALSPVQSFADELSQAEAMYQASLVQKAGSEAALRQSTTNAMKGLMDLAAQKRASAIENGYKAYGQYVNSEDMDYMNLKNQLGYYKIYTHAAQASASGTSKARTLDPVTLGYGKLDPKFLREGEAGKVADEFEKKSGMKRDQFLKIMAKASASTISPRDPKLVDKVISRFEGFVKEIPNDEFRQSIEKTIAEVPSTVRTGLISKGVQKIAEIMAKMPPEKNAPALAIKAPDSPERSPAAAVAIVAGPEATPVAGVTPIIAETEPGLIGMKMVPNESGYKGIDKEKFGVDVLGSVMQTAIDEQKEETIFKQVSKKYRAMTPKLSLVSDTQQ